MGITSADIQMDVTNDLMYVCERSQDKLCPHS